MFQKQTEEIEHSVVPFCHSFFRNAFRVWIQFFFVFNSCTDVGAKILETLPFRKGFLVDGADIHETLIGEILDQ